MRKYVRISLALVIIEIIIAAIVFPFLPEQIPIHWNNSGVVDGYGSKWMIFFLPGISAAVIGLLLVLPVIDPLGKNIMRSVKAYGIVILSTVTLIAVLFVATLMTVFEVPVSVEKVTPVAVGIMFIVIGNYLPKTKRSFTFGIRFPWTVLNDDVWAKTHRVGAWAFMANGLLFIAGAFMPPPMNYIVPISGLFIFLIGIGIYSFFEYRKVSDIIK